MSSGIPRKKRLSLQDVVDKLSLGVLGKVSEDDEIEEVKLADEPTQPVVHEKRRSSTHRLHLAKAFAAPSSPNVSESSAEDAPTSDKEIIDDELPKESGPVEPMRCGVCGLRVFKSYRYISRGSAPMHLKIFFDPDTERFRVCKRCFSSKERCRQNLALLLLKSQTEENSHLKSPLGTTQGRRTQGLKYIFRDIARSLKRPYEDLICDETFDDDYLSDGDENLPLKAIKKEPVSAKFNDDVEKPAGAGVVTVVRPSSNTYQIFPNHFTIYGELGQNKTVESDGKAEVTKDVTLIKTNKKPPEEKIVEKEDKDGVASTNGELKSEIRTINYKLTLLDHAYALPAAKTVKQYNKPPKPVLENLPKVKNDSVAKAAIKTLIKNNSMAKKVPSSSSTENKSGQPSRTCGIICSMCKNLVTKSYSCYRKENAPDKIKSYFTGDVKVMKVCRRCVPYKKPKGDTQPSKVVKNKVKILQAKLMKQKIKNAKKASKVEVKASKNEISTQTKDKTSLKSTKDDTKAKSVEKGTKESKKVESSLVHLSPKKDATVVHVSIKNGKVESTSNNVIKTIFPPIGNSAGNDMKTDSKQKTTNKQTNVEVKTTANGQQLGPVMLVHLQSPLDLQMVLDKEKNGGNTGSVDFGTQPMHSMIGLKKAKSKTSKKDEDDEKKTERKQTKDTTKGGDVSKSAEDNKKITEAVKEKDSTQAKTENAESKEKEKEKEKKKETVTKDKDLKAKSKTEQTTENPTEKGALRKLNVESQNSKGEGKIAKPTISKPLIEPVRSSPRRDKNIVPPEKTKKDAEQKIPTITAATKKKKEASEPETESTKQTDEKPNAKQNEGKNSEKRSEEKPSEKVEVALKRSTRKGRGMKRKDSESETSSTAGSVDDDKKEIKRARSAEAKSMDNDKKTEISVTNHNYSTRWAQSPIKCGCCHENVIKSYRCIQLGSSPVHLKPVFTKEGKNNLRICRKCLNFPSRVKSFL